MGVPEAALASFRRYEQPAELVRSWHAHGYYDDTLPGAAITAAHRRWPWRVAVVDGERRVTHGELDAAVTALAGSLRAAGVGPGDVVSWQCPNWWESIAVALATWRIGAVNNPILTIYREHELGQILDDLRPAAVIAPARFRNTNYPELLDAVIASVGHEPSVKAVVRGEAPGWTGLPELLDAGAAHADPVAVDPDAPCVVAYTSGTTARAKGVVVSSRQFMAETRQMGTVWGIAWDDTTFMPAPLAHLTGTTVGLSVPLSVGGSVALMDVWDAELAVPLIERERAVFSSGTPTFLEELCNAYERSDTEEASLRQFSVGGAVVSPTLIERCQAAGISAFRCYGMTEHLSTTIMNAGYPLETRRDTDGPIAPGSEVSAVDEDGRALPAGSPGELRVRGPERMLGYVDPADSAAALEEGEGWFSTGDIGFVDADGCVHFTGRIKDIINRGGEKFSAREMEDVICRHGSIRQAAVVPIPDERLGETPAAFLVLREGSAEPTREELERFVADQGLAKQKTPTDWRFVERLPTTPFGKVKKQELIASFDRTRERG